MNRFEDKCYAEQPKIDAQAKILFEQNPESAVAYVTDYSVNTAQSLFDTWSALDQYLLVKFIDGNIKKESSEGVFIDNGNNFNICTSPSQPGYSEKWKRKVAEDAGKTIQKPN